MCIYALYDRIYFVCMAHVCKYIHTHIYARVMERTVFGRPKAWMFVGGFGAVPGVWGGSRLAGSTRSISLFPLTWALAGSGIPERAGRGLKAKATRRF